MSEPSPEEPEGRRLPDAAPGDIPGTQEKRADFHLRGAADRAGLPDVPGDPEGAEPADSTAADILSMYMRDIGAHPVLTRAEERALALRARKGDEDAFGQLVRSNLRYVVSVAKRYRHFGLSLEDLINEGNIGLIHAIRRFDPDKGVKLITYAIWWIRQSIMHAMADQKNTVRLPVKQAGLLHKISITHERLRQELRREPTMSELADQLDVKAADICKLMRANQHCLSLDAAVSPDDDTSYLDLLEEQNAVSVEESAARHSLEEEVEDLLQELDPREREIIRMRYGFDGEAMTLEEIGRKLGLSRERVRQIEKKVIQRFRAQGSRQTLHDFLG